MDTDAAGPATSAAGGSLANCHHHSSETALAAVGSAMDGPSGSSPFAGPTSRPFDMWAAQGQHQQQAQAMPTEVRTHDAVFACRMRLWRCRRVCGIPSTLMCESMCVGVFVLHILVFVLCGYQVTGEGFEIVVCSASAQPRMYTTDAPYDEKHGEKSW